MLSNTIKPPSVSIITAVRNGVNGIARTINSVRNQDFCNIEYIIIDGGSNDGTIDVIKKNSDCISQWISEKDSGIYDAWNKGIERSIGDWICFIGAGDTLMPDAISKMVDIGLQLSNCEYISGQVLIQYNNGVVRRIGREWKWNIFRHYMCVAHVGSLQSRSLYERYGSYNSIYKAAGDYEFLLRSKDKLIAIYLNDLIAEMAPGGISATNRIVLSESLSAKLTNNAVSSCRAYLDYYIATAKWVLRGFMGLR